MKLKNTISFVFLFIFIIILSGCFKDNKPNVYLNSEVKGQNILSNIILNFDSNNKTVKVKYGDYESDSCKISFTKSNKVVTSEVKNEIGIKNKYENETFYYDIKLSDTDNKKIISLIKAGIEEELKDEPDTNHDAVNLKGFTITGVGMYIERHLYNGKIRDGINDFYTPYISFESGGMYYDGNLSYKIIYA